MTANTRAPPQDRDTTTRHTTALQQGHQANKTGDTNTKTGRPMTLPPFYRHATHHPSCHPTIHNAPTHHHDEGVADIGYPTTQRPQEDTHYPHTTHPARNSAQHDSSTRQHCNGMSRARATSLHQAAQQHTPPPFHTPHTEEDGHHPLIHSHTVHIHTTNERSRSTLINNHCSIIEQ